MVSLAVAVARFGKDDDKGWFNEENRVRDILRVATYSQL
jgi:hypothetical protein